MVFPVVGGNESKGYEISNSLRINAGDSAYLSRTQTAGNQRTFTASVWVKRSRLNDRQAIFSASADGSNECFIWFDTDDELFVKENTSNSTDFEIRTNRKFRDPSAWYHIVVAYDTTNSTSGDRVRIYVNGVEETSFANETQPNQNFQTKFNKNSQALDIGRMNYGQEYFGGYLTEIHWVDGSQLAPTSFGEFDDNGVWIPKKYTGSYGTNGYFLQFKQTGTSQNSSGIGADTSGEDNHFAVTNLAATDITEDTCTNNFATLNPLINSSVTFSEGNTKATVGGTVPRVAASTFSVTSGKWYCEVKITATAAGATLFGVEADDFPQNATVYSNGDGVTYNTNGTATTDGSNASYGATYAADDIMGIALNLDDNEITFYKNGASQGAISKTFSGGYVFIGSHGSSSNSSGYNFNFGNPSFSISSGNTDGKYGNFEYAPPSGYYALCTKRLAEFG
jgi:hypothetical protein